MRILRKILEPEKEEIEMPVLSEQMIRRDNFFHSCWMDLKQKRPDLWSIMDDCELNIAGLSETEEISDDDGTETDQIL